MVFRHCPTEPRMNRAFPEIAATRPNLFNAYQQTHGERVEKALTNAEFVVSFIGRVPGQALFVGLYKVLSYRSITREEFWRIPEHQELRIFGMQGFDKTEERESKLQFQLQYDESFYSSWKRKLVIGWPGKEVSWWRWADRNIMPILAIHDLNQLEKKDLKWKEVNWAWRELPLYLDYYQHALKEWCAIYYIFDSSDLKGYVGSASGEDKLLQRWSNYRDTGHGGNKMLKMRNPENFHFSILERVSPDVSSDEVIALENSWKERLNTRQPTGLNEN